LNGPGETLARLLPIKRNITVEFTRVFKPGTADQQELLTVLELLLNEPLPAPAPSETSATDSRESVPSK
jgi:hypothetical protein